MYSAYNDIFHEHQIRATMDVIRFGKKNISEAKALPNTVGTPLMYNCIIHGIPRSWKCPFILVLNQFLGALVGSSDKELCKVLDLLVALQQNASSLAVAK